MLALYPVGRLAMVAQNANMAEIVAAAARTPAVETPPSVSAFPGDPAIAISRIHPVAATITAAEPNVPNLAHASVVCSTIAKGRIVDIDAAAAFLVEGVVSILTHQNLPDIVNDDACAGETIPPGTHCSLLRDGEIAFKGQPVALVVARTPEIARHAASLIRVEYEKNADATDVQLRDAIAEGDDPMELGASTAIFENPSRISIRDKTHGAQGLPQYLRSRFGCGLRPQFQAMLAARAALALRSSVRVVLTLQQMRDFACAPRQAVTPGRA